MFNLKNMHFVYVIYNTATKKYYVGQTQCVNIRFKEHKTGKNYSTKFKCEYWNLVYVEMYVSKKDALTRERKLKAHGSGMVEIKKRIINSVDQLNLKLERE